MNYFDSNHSQSPILIYIASDVRSGSTLLDMLLGGHPDIISIGELQFLKDHVQKRGTGYSWDWKCTCEKDFDTCPFWVGVNRLVKQKRRGGLKSMETWAKRHGLLFGLLLFPNQIARAFVKSFPSIRTGMEAAGNCWQVADAIQSMTGQRYIVDSSKNAEQLRFMHWLRPKQVKMIYLIRDGRAVTYSKITRAGDSARKAAKNWVIENLKLLLIKQLFLRSDALTLKYEDLCSDPEFHVDMILSFLDVPKKKVKLCKQGRHNICGSPHRFDKENTEIRLDTRWKQKMDKADLKTFNLIGGWLNYFTGYR